MSSSRNRRTRAPRRREGASLSSSSENPSARHLRIQSTLFQEVSLLFRDGLSDPRLEGVSVSSFELSADGRLVRIGYALTPESAASGTRPVQEALEHASGYLRSQLAQHLDLKRVPQLRFIYLGVAERSLEAPDVGLLTGTSDLDEPVAEVPEDDSDLDEPARRPGGKSHRGDADSDGEEGGEQ
ncbi:ribosome-binding factor A [Pyxidicoccus xibeiensis]|uniref:ribosome-binding factor A n=1 Tax=Pyxidicoccus xibeiensis TaxID=2906759 RepID=UPI0020A83330|nr:ribosome-binding factor A [Pyxidicoccus xibeiensis]MCP3136686.1 ribosome-binding factor A [Pyxidicoccus xibeiensis]